ncbi:Histone acetyltransferase type B subunit 2, partial [Neolecta irregularis DAH-3]
DQNFLQIAHIQIPNANVDVSKYDEEKEAGGHTGIASRVTVVQKIPHEGEVNRARYMPQNPEMIATWTVSGDVLVFDRTKHSNHSTGACNPQIRLKGHTKEGYGLAWNPQKEGHLVSGSEDTFINAWDITSFSKEKATMSPCRTYKTHSSVVNDIAFHPHHDSLFGSVSDDCTLQIHDTRSTNDTKASHEIQAHKSAINALAFNPASEYVLATAGADQTVALWDLRNLKNKLHTFEGHRNEVVGLQWSPHEEAILASSSIDRRVILWDLSKIGEEQTPEDSEDGGPELACTL